LLKKKQKKKKKKKQRPFTLEFFTARSSPVMAKASTAPSATLAGSNAASEIICSF